MRAPGIDQSADTADRVAPSWRGEATAKIAEFARRARSQNFTFTIEEARVAAKIDVPLGVDGRAFGSITQELKRSGAIEPTGQFAPAASSNGSPKPVYRAGAGA